MECEEENGDRQEGAKNLYKVGIYFDMHDSNELEDAAEQSERTGSR